MRKTEFVPVFGKYPSDLAKQLGNLANGKYSDYVFSQLIILHTEKGIEYVDTGDEGTDAPVEVLRINAIAVFIKNN